MLKKSLKIKLVAGALGLILMVSMAITVTVAVIINRQNRTAVNLNLDNAMAIVRDDLKERTAEAADQIEQMIQAEKVGGTVKFLSEFAEDELTISHNAYITLATALLNRVRSGGFRSIGIYDINGALQTFAEATGSESLRYGFLHQKTLHISKSSRTAGASTDEWTQTANADRIGIPAQLGGRPPSARGIQFVPLDNRLAIRIVLPVTALDFDENGDDIIKPVGRLEAYKRLDQQMISRLARLTGMSVNLFVGHSFSMGDLPDHATLPPGDIPARTGSEWTIDSQQTTLGEFDLKGQTYFQAVLPIYSADAYAGAAAVLQSDQGVRANNRQMITILAGVALMCVALCTPLAIMVSGTIVKQISGVAVRLKDIAEGDGDLTKRIEVTSRDEIGQLAEWFNAFIGNIHSIIREVKENAQNLSLSSSDLSDIAGLMASGSEQTSAKAIHVADSGGTMSTNMQSVATTMEESASKVQIVAAAAEELNATIAEITRNTGSACDITTQAVEQAQNASSQVAELGQAATEIGKVIDAITDISDQVNLLALNATIEAARAGEAGKGFAVVANEIKELARQTAEATDEIRTKVEGIQNSTDGTIDQIEQITRVVNNVNDIVSTIATSVEEQSTTTASIAENVQQVSHGIGDANQNVSNSSSVASEIAAEIQDVTRASAQITDHSNQVKRSAVDLSQLSDKLKGLVDQFKV